MEQEDVVNFFDNMTVLEVIALTKFLEEKWGVKAVPAPVQSMTGYCDGCKRVITGPHACPGDNDAQTEFTVTLVSVSPAAKMSVIKLVRETCLLGLKESKDLVEGAPKMLKEGLTSAEAEELKRRMTEAGALIEVK